MPEGIGPFSYGAPRILSRDGNQATPPGRGDDADKDEVASRGAFPACGEASAEAAAAARADPPQDPLGDVDEPGRRWS